MPNRDVPGSNKICHDTWKRQDQLSHQRRLSRTKSFIDTSAPTKHQHLFTRAKQEQLQEERYTRIEHENKLLLSKMSRIMRSHSLDNLHVSKKATSSLNAGVRRKQLKKIMDENQRILQRIQGRKAFYTKQAFDDHALTHAGYRASIGERQKRLLPTLYKDPRATTAPERGTAKPMLEPIRKKEFTRGEPARKTTKAKTMKPSKAAPMMKTSNPKAKPTTSIKPAPIKQKKTKKATTKKSNGLIDTKGGYNIEGNYVIVTTQEQKTADSHSVIFSTYDVDEGLTLTCSVPMATLQGCVAPELFKGDQGKLVDALITFLGFEGTPSFDKLVFKSDAAAAAAPAPAPEAEAAPVEVELAVPVGAGGNLSLKLSSASVLDTAISASFQLFTGGKLISKTENISFEAGQAIADGTFESIDLQTNDKSKDLELKLFDKETTELATATFTMGSLEEGTAVPLKLDDIFTVTLEFSSVSAEVSIDLGA